MLDIGPPPPGIYEKAPSGLFLPKNGEKLAILPGMTPYPGLFGGADTYGAVKSPIFEPPTTYSAFWNTLNVTSPQNATNTPVLSEYSEVLIFVGLRGNINNDPITPVMTLTDNQGGTYSLVDPLVIMNPASGGSWFFGLYKRDAKVPAGGLPATTFTLAWTTTSAASYMTGGLVFEVKNPTNWPFHIVRREINQRTSTGVNTMSNSGDPFCMDFLLGQGTTAGSAGSGYQQIYNSTAFFNSTCRISVMASGNQTQTAGRTWSTTNLQTVLSYAMWLDGPQRSKPSLQWFFPSDAQSAGYNASENLTFNLGPEAPDRQVLIFCNCLRDNTGSNTNIGGGTMVSPPSDAYGPVILWGVPAQQMPATVFWYLVPSGASLTLNFTHSTTAFGFYYAVTLYGAETLLNSAAGLITPTVLAGSGFQGWRYAQAASQNGPFRWLDAVVPKKTLLLGVAGSRAAAATALGWSRPTPPTITANYTMLGAIDNLANDSDLTAQQVGISYSGSVAVNLGYLIMGP